MGKKIWSNEEIEFLKSNINLSEEEIAIKLGNKTKQQIRDKKNNLNIYSYKKKIINWEPLIDEYKNGVHIKLLSNKYNVKENSIIGHLIKLNIYNYSNNKWSDDDELFLIDNINILSNIEIAYILNKDIFSVNYKCYKLNIINNTVYYFNKYIFKNKNEQYLYDIINDRLNKNELIDYETIKEIYNINNLSKYCVDNYGIGYENFLLTFFNINYDEYTYKYCIELYLKYSNKRMNISKDFLTDLRIGTILAKYVIENILNIYNEEDFYNVYCEKILKDYKLITYLWRNKISVIDFPKLIYPNYKNLPYLFKKVACSYEYWENENNVFYAIDYMVEDLIINNKLSSYNDVVNLIRKDFIQYNISGILYNKSIIEVLDFYLFRKTGEKIDMQYYITKGFFDYKNIDDLKIIIKWVLEEKSNWDGKDIEWLRNNFHKNLFHNNGVSNIDRYLTKNKNIEDNSLFTLLKITYPELDLYAWELPIVPTGFWHDKNNTNLALKQLIENRLNLNINDIPKVINNRYFDFYYTKFCFPLKKIYEGNIFNWINEIYPNIFTPRDFGYIECLDGTLVKSFSEQLIHNYLFNTYSNFKYIHNTKENNGYYKNNNYFPDWIISEKYIIEYLGMFRKDKEKIKSKILLDYHNKTIDKIKFSNDNDSHKYEFIFIYEQDLLQDLKGLKEKLKIIENSVA